jgi:transposase
LLNGKKHAFELFKKGISAKKIAKTYRVNYSKATKWRRSALGIITKKSTTKASRSTAAKKGAQTKAVNKAKRSAAAKKGAQTKAVNKTKRFTTSKKKTTKKKKRYTLKFQREAMKLIQDGHSGLEVSDILGVNKDTIRKWRKKHGLSGSTNKYSTNFQNDVLDQIRDGKSNLEISRITGASSTAVANWRKKFDKEGF